MIFLVCSRCYLSASDESPVLRGGYSFFSCLAHSQGGREVCEMLHPTPGPTEMTPAPLTRLVTRSSATLPTAAQHHPRLPADHGALLRGDTEVEENRSGHESGLCLRSSWTVAGSPACLRVSGG